MNMHVDELTFMDDPKGACLKGFCLALDDILINMHKVDITKTQVLTFFDAATSYLHDLADAEDTVMGCLIVTGMKDRLEDPHATEINPCH
jgi:hypothetical protein